MARPRKNDTAADLVPVISRAARLVRPTYADPRPEQKGTLSVTIVPGVNYVPADIAELAGIGHPQLDPFAGMPDVLVGDPASLDEYAALAMAKISGSRKALRVWKARETRPNVLKAIDARLGAPARTETVSDTTDDVTDGPVPMH